jgi:hypothetical protein
MSIKSIVHSIINSIVLTSTGFVQLTLLVLARTLIKGTFSQLKSICKKSTIWFLKKLQRSWRSKGTNWFQRNHMVSKETPT